MQPAPCSGGCLQCIAVVAYHGVAAHSAAVTYHIILMAKDLRLVVVDVPMSCHHRFLHDSCSGHVAHCMQADTTPNVLETQTHEALGPCTALCEGPLKQGHSSHPVQLGTTASTGPGQYTSSTRVVGGTSALHAASSTQDLTSAAGTGAAGAPSPWLLITGELHVATMQ
jgi:hypothetical protein